MRSERAPVALCLVVLLAVAGCSSAGSSASTASSAPAATAARHDRLRRWQRPRRLRRRPRARSRPDVTGERDRARLARLRPGHFWADFKSTYPKATAAFEIGRATPTSTRR